MLKLTSLALGLITAIAIVPAAQAATTVNPLSLDRPVDNLHAQIILRTGERQKNYRHHDGDRHHQLRERLVRRHHRDYSHHDR
jgi:hypothetical protein